MQRREFIKTLSATAAVTGLSFSQTGCTHNRKPNVILFITDDQGYGDLSCHGNPILKTPAMDALHAESVRLTNFHVGPTCAPTRASLMTGRYCNRTGVWHTVMGRSLLREDEKTMAEVFKENGYQTAMFGKWHLGDNAPFSPHLRGFDKSIVHGGGGVGQTPDAWDNDYFDDTYWEDGKQKAFNGYCTDVFFREAKSFIESNKRRPFFCYLATNAPHGPFHVEDHYAKPYLEQGVFPARARFYGMITNLDENLAEMQRFLKEHDLDENTIFIFMTDNGTSMGAATGKGEFVTDGYNAGMRGKKVSAYDGGHRVPCFIKWPAGISQKGVDVKDVTAHIDLMPTLAGLCGMQLNAPNKIDGKDISPLIKGSAGQWKERILVTDNQRVDIPRKWKNCSVMTNQWRLIDGKELYDMKSDPGQTKDIADRNPQKVEELRAAYEAWWADVSTRFDDTCHIQIGHGDTTERLTCHDWHDIEHPEGEKLRKMGREVPPPWNQPHVRMGNIANGYWAVEVVETGEYEFRLRRWPDEVDAALTTAIPAGGPIPGGSPLPAGKALNINHARLKAGHQEVESTVQADSEEVVFRLKLKAGKTRLKTWFSLKDGRVLGAYFVYAKRLI